MYRLFLALTACALALTASACGRSPSGLIAVPSATPEPAPTTAGSLWAPASPPSTVAGAGVIAGALHDVLTRLNQDTAATAQGELFVLDQLSQAVRQKIEQLLKSPPHGYGG